MPRHAAVRHGEGHVAVPAKAVRERDASVSCYMQAIGELMDGEGPLSVVRNDDALPSISRSRAV